MVILEPFLILVTNWSFVTKMFYKLSKKRPSNNYNFTLKSEKNLRFISFKEFYRCYLAKMY